MLTVLVTGGAGYIGSHTCKALSRAGYLPVTFDNMSAGHEWAVKWGPLEKGDIRDLDRLTEVLNKYNPCAIMHFAASIAAGESVENPLSYYDNNVVGALRLLDAAHSCGVRHIVFSSSATVYGSPDSNPIDEDHPIRPTNPYGRTKAMIETILRDSHTAHNFQVICFRYFNAAGADPDGDIGEAHEPETHLIPLVLEAAINGTEIQIFGTDYDTPDGTCIRDYVHVTDLAEAHVLGLKQVLDDPGFDAFNLGTGRGYSVKEVIRLAEQVAGLTIRTRDRARRRGDPPALVSSAARAQTKLAWSPARPELSSTIIDAWRWRMRDHNKFTVKNAKPVASA